MDRGYSQYGVGISNADYMGTAMNGHPNPNQAYAGFSSGEFTAPTEHVDMGKTDFEEEISKPRKLKPILTRNGKILAAIIILSFAGYIVWKKHKANKIAENAEAPATEPQVSPDAVAPPADPAPEPSPEPPKTIQQPVSDEPIGQPEA